MLLNQVVLFVTDGIFFIFKNYEMNHMKINHIKTKKRNIPIMSSKKENIHIKEFGK